MSDAEGLAALSGAKVYDNGDGAYTVRVMGRHVAEWKRRWPGFGAYPSSGFIFGFARNGDLVELTTGKGGDSEKYDGSGLVALSEDAQEYGRIVVERRAKTKTKNATAGKARTTKPAGYRCRACGAVTRRRPNACASCAGRKGAAASARNRTDGVDPDLIWSHKKWVEYILKEGYRDEGGSFHMPKTRKEAEREARSARADQIRYYESQGGRDDYRETAYDDDVRSDVHGRL